jgi:hypothetical protein
MRESPANKRENARSISSDPVIEAYKANIDISSIRKNLGLTPEERLVQQMELQRTAEELRRAGLRAKKVR